MTLLLACMLVGMWTVWTGPACDGVRQRRRARREFPHARVTFLLSAGHME